MDQGAIMAQVAVTALSLDFLSSTHWVARSFLLATLLAGCLSVYYAMHLLRMLGRLVTAAKVKDWLRSPPERVRSRYKNRPSIAAVLILDTPRALVNTAAVTFIVALSIYVVFVFVNHLDLDAAPDDSRNVVIVYFVALWFCMALYTKADMFDYYTNRRRTWRDIVHVWATTVNLLGSRVSDHEDELPTHSSNEERSTIQTGGVQPLNGAESTIEGRQDPTIPSTQEESPVSAIESSLMAVLNEAIDARRRCLQADEQLVAALERYKNGISQ